MSQKISMGMGLKLTQKPILTIVQMNCSNFMSCYECYSALAEMLNDLPLGEIRLQCSSFKLINLPLDKKPFTQTGPPQPDDIYF